MSLISLLIALLIICLIFWAARQIMGVFQLDARIQTVVTVIMVVFVCLWLAQQFLVAGPFLGNIRLQ